MVDTGSHDATITIARRAGAQVVEHPFEGFLATRRFALGQVRTEWTFMLDADERLDPVLQSMLLEAEPGPETDAYQVLRRTWFAGRPMSGCGWGDEPMLRVFRTGRGVLAAKPTSGGVAELHERWSVPGAVGTLRGRLEHESYRSIGDYLDRFNRYTSIEATGLTVTPAIAARRLAMVPVRAIWLLGPKGGWRDGWRGAFVAIFSALYPLAATLKALRA